MKDGWKTRLWAPSALLGIIVVWLLLLLIANNCADEYLSGRCFEHWLSRYQTLLGAFLAGLGILVAYRSVTRQLTVNVISREEDAD